MANPQRVQAEKVRQVRMARATSREAETTASLARRALWRKCAEAKAAGVSLGELARACETQRWHVTEWIAKAEREQSKGKAS